MSLSVASDGGNPAMRVRERIRQWLALTGLGQREFATQLGKTQVWLQKILTEGPQGNDVRLRDLDVIASCMRTSASELIRSAEDGRYMMQLTPTEVRVLEQLRLNPVTFQAVSDLLRVASHPKGPQPGKRGLPYKKRHDFKTPDGDGKKVDRKA